MRSNDFNKRKKGHFDKHRECKFEKHMEHRMRAFEKREENIKIHKMMKKGINELYLLHRYMHFFKNFTLIITLVIVLFMFKVIGFKAASVIITLVLLINEFTIIYMISRLEKKFIAPMEKLQRGVKQISEGDYSIRIVEDNDNEIGILTREFNRMAMKLEEGEKVKKEYENNRKELIANISHDLKTPITSINGYVEGLLENVVPKDKADNYLKTIRSNANYMNKLIDDLFLFSKLDMQKLDFSFTITNIKYYIFDIVEELNFMLEEKGIGFSYIDNIENGVFVNLDGKRLYRSIRNLIDNAIKYGTCKNDLNIKINLRQNDEFIFIDVVDNGPGIEGDKINNIFDRFYRIDKERTKDFTSTGLGLAIAKEIIEAHDGRIYVESELGVGSTFTIVLPIAKSEEEVE